MQKITPFLWFNGNAEEAMDFYTTVFKDSKVGAVSRYPAGAPGGLEGKVMVGTFALNGQEFMVLNGDAKFEFNHSVSFLINCTSQEEVDYYWNALSADGGATEQCGWLKDKFGLSWQVVPTRLGELMSDEDKIKAGRVMEAMMQMTKIEIDKLEVAYKGA